MRVPSIFREQPPQHCSLSVYARLLGNMGPAVRGVLHLFQYLIQLHRKLRSVCFMLNSWGSKTLLHCLLLNHYVQVDGHHAPYRHTV